MAAQGQRYNEKLESHTKALSKEMTELRTWFKAIMEEQRADGWVSPKASSQVVEDEESRYPFGMPSMELMPHGGKGLGPVLQKDGPDGGRGPAAAGRQGIGGGNAAQHDDFHPMRLDFPRFDGTDPSTWYFKASLFFNYHQTNEASRLTIASFYMDEVLVQWEGFAPEDATWELKDRMIEAYPDFNLEDKVVREGGKNVMNLNDTAAEPRRSTRRRKASRRLVEDC